MTPAAFGVVRRPYRVDLAAERGQGLLEVRRRLLAVPDSRRLGGRRDAGGLHDLDGAVMEHLGVAVGGVAAHVHDDRGRRVLAGGGEAVDDGLALEASDLEVVERHVVVGALDRTVVRDDRDALGLGLLGNRTARAVVVDEQHHAAALAELLVGDGGVLVDVGLGVLDVGLEAGGGEALFEILDGRCSPSAATTRRRGGSRRRAWPPRRLPSRHRNRRPNSLQAATPRHRRALQ